MNSPPPGERTDEAKRQSNSRLDCDGLFLQHMRPKGHDLVAADFRRRETLRLDGLQNARGRHAQDFQPLAPVVICPIAGNDDQVNVAAFVRRTCRL